MSLRRASLTVRLEGHRFWEDAHGMRHASRQNALAARYLDLFGTAIDARLAPARCPKILVLDSKPLNLREYGAEKSDPSWNRDERDERGIRGDRRRRPRPSLHALAGRPRPGRDDPILARLPR
jgi:hypothetical protein